VKKTIMIIGGGLLQTPVITTAKKMGYQVIVTDYNPDAIGMKDADIPIVMSTRDIQGSVRVAKRQNEITPISGVLTVGTDASMTVAAVANALDLPGIKFDDAEAATNKLKMRMRFKEYNIPSPAFLPVWTLSDAKKGCKILGFPVVMKPSDNMGARGVMRIDNANQVADAFKFAKSASPSGELIIEQFMDGPELSIDAIIFNEEITITGVADRIIEYPPNFVETGHTMPSHLKIEMLEDACDVMRRGVKALGLTTGAAKGDIKVTKSGAMIGEIAARLSGGFMSSYTYPLSSGVDLMKAMIEVSLGHEPGNLEPVFNKVAIERAIICRPGVVKKISGLEEALKVPGVEEIFLNVKEGDTVVKPTSNVEKSGNIIAVGDTLKQAEASVKQCMDLLNIETSDDSEISMKTINALAREKFKKICYVCKSCDGYECASGVPGMGGTGAGDSFRRNADALKQFKVITTLIHEGVVPDTSAVLFGHKISFPVMAAPITGSVTNMNGAIEELDYNIAVVKGCKNSGTIAFVGDGATPDKYKIGLEAIEKENGWGIPIFKPRKDNNEIIMRFKAAEKAGAIAAGIDIDAVVFKTMAMKNQEVAAKSVSELMEIKASTSLPFILKGIMNPRDAEMACKAGADAIIVSNHGGRVLDQMPGSMDVLQEIVAAVGKSITIMIDGGFRDGVDVLKAIALGADFVLIGRPVAIAAVGMGIEGTSFYLDKIKEEFSKAMVLTGCNTVKDIKSDLIRRV